MYAKFPVETERYIADVEESKDEETLKGRDDVTINNKRPNRKMGIDRIK